MTIALESSFASIAHLRGIATPAAEFRVLAFGLPELDGRLGAGGLRAGGLHEATAQSCSLVDDAAATLFLAGIAAREAHAAGGPVLWASCRTDLYAPGLEQAGLAAADVIYAQPRDDAALLAVIEDAIRDGTPSAVVAGRAGCLWWRPGASSLSRRKRTCRCCCCAGDVAVTGIRLRSRRPAWDALADRLRAFRTAARVGGWAAALVGRNGPTTWWRSFFPDFGGMR